MGVPNGFVPEWTAKLECVICLAEGFLDLPGDPEVNGLVRDDGARPPLRELACFAFLVA